ncbi:sorting nexin-8-like isoform X2 [Sabethes cyaneus]|uniref:sorting nexin-8-like isoform X2 n=1 Tax=Sabethes cyaneus TaxID=53552 RepID=UPI00237D6FE0|nr:sorting nexin-8-like isoform X2 [Sabethes cyaneus]
MSTMVESSPVAMVTISRSSLSTKSAELDSGMISDSRFGAVDPSRSPSVGETFVSAGTDGPVSSSDSDSDDDSSEGEGNQQRRGEGSSLNNTNHNSVTAFDHVSSLPLEDGTVGGIRPLSPGEGPSGSTSMSLSMGSMGDELADRSPSQPLIVVTLIPEKKSIFLKYSEYEIKARAYDTVVRRRYKDFLTLFNYLVEKYPYRIIPKLPPKPLLSDSHFAERSRNLQTWLTILSMHPVLGSSPILVTFLSDKTEEYLFRMNVKYEKQIDEFGRLRKDVDLPMEDLEKLTAGRDRLQKVHQSLRQLRKIFDEQASRAEGQARDMAEVDLILQGLEVPNVFGHNTFDELSQSAQTVARHSETYVQLQRHAVNERIHVLMEVLSAHNDLCDRVEKGIFADHQKALSKSHGTGKSKTTGATSSSTLNVDPAQQPEESQPREVVDQCGRRCAFALQCVRSETSLTEKYLHSLPSILLAYAHEESQYHSKMSKIWHQLVANESSKLC